MKQNNDTSKEPTMKNNNEKQQLNNTMKNNNETAIKKQ